MPMRQYLTPSGRSPRAKLLIGLIAPLPIWFMLIFLSMFIEWALDGVRPGMWVFIPAGVAVVAYEIILLIRRLHDLDRPGRHILLLLIPGYNILMALIVLAMPGTSGRNSYGPDPLAGRRSS